ncbi:DUF1801 domain-containing protein [Botryobacter ruber]|uniref:DUF1801 domain-containing protein n=1 Tax=Botryobacter ruber TaxID=2171629 RepID=UPI000E0C8F76|nr:DUF1801 domain-containing protein [Botryobacter ruber]
MAELKTKENDLPVEAFLNSIEPEKKRSDAFKILQLMREATGLEPTMWGTNMVGFGKYSYRYNSGHSGESFLVGFSPRKQNLTLYLMTGFERPQALMEKLGKYKNGKACLYINKLEDVNLDVLQELVKDSLAATAQMEWVTIA